MCREHDLDALVTREEVQALTRLVSQRWMDSQQGKRGADLSVMDFETFEKFLVQLAHFAFSRPPKDLRSLHIGAMIDELFQTIALGAKRRGQSALVFEDPDATLLNADPDTMRALNKILSENPQHPLPDNYRKVVEK